jgi:hypothetical protein
MVELTSALITGSILSVLFANTRTIGIICVAVLTFLYLIPMVIVVLFGVGTYVKKKNKKYLYEKNICSVITGCCNPVELTPRNTTIHLTY